MSGEVGPRVQQARDAVAAFVGDGELEWEAGARDGEVVVTLPGEKKLKTVTSLVVGESALSLSAFVIRNPDEAHERFYRYLLRRNLRLPGIAYAIDQSGDVYVTGRFPLAAVDATFLDEVLGAVLDAADSPFNELLVIGFLTSMKREWAWRVTHDESLANLEAFRTVLEGSEHEVQLGRGGS